MALSSRSFAGSGEILDEIVTRGRGEIRRMNSSKVTSSTATPIGLNSPRFSDKAYSPRVSELRREQSPRLSGKEGISPRPSKLGESSHASTSSK